MSSVRLPALEILTQTLCNIPDSHRSLLTKLTVVSILLFRTRVFAPVLTSKPHSINKFKKPLFNDLKHSVQAGDAALLYLDEDQDDKGTQTLFVPFRGKISKVIAKHLERAIIMLLNPCRSK